MFGLNWLVNLLAGLNAWVKWVIWDYYYGIVRSIVLQAPSIGLFPGVRVGGWENKPYADICAQLSNDDANFWTRHPDECEAKIERHITGYAILFWWPLTLYLGINFYHKFLTWVFSPKTSTSGPVAGGAPTPTQLLAGRRRTPEQNAESALRGAKTKASNEEKRRFYDMTLPFLHQLLLVAREDPGRPIGEFLRLTPLPIPTALLALPAAPAPPAPTNALARSRTGSESLTE